MGGGKAQRPAAVEDDGIVILDDEAPTEDGGNAFVLSLLRARLQQDPIASARSIRAHGAAATDSAAQCDQAGLDLGVESLQGVLGAFAVQLTTLELQDAVLDASRADLTAEEREELTAAQAAGDRASDTAFSGAYGLGGSLWPTRYRDQDLTGMFARTVPEAEPGAAGVPAWVAWVDDRHDALSDLLARAEAVRGFARERVDELEGLPLLAGAVTLATLGLPPELTAATGREHEFLLAALREEWPAWTHDLVGRDVDETRREAAATDAGVDPDAIPGLRELVDAAPSMEPEEVAGALSELGGAERAFVIGGLRAGEPGWAALLDDADDETRDHLEHLAGRGDEGLADYNTAGTLAVDAGRGVPGSVANVGWGMVKSVPILGDVADYAAGEHVNAGIDHLNQEWMGMDAGSSAQQQAIGQVSGQVAGSIGLAGIAGPTAATEGVAARVPDAVRLGLFGMDFANSAWQATTGQTATGVEIPWWARVLAGVGVTANASAARGAAKMGSVTPDAAQATAEIARRHADEMRTDPDLADALAEFLAPVLRRADWAEEHADRVRRLSVAGEDATDVALGSTVTKVIGEAVDTPEERAKFSGASEP